MTPHIHIDPVVLLAGFAMTLIAGSLWRYAAIRMGDTKVSRAMLFAY